jgi:hypothetical protein
MIFILIYKKLIYFTGTEEIVLRGLSILNDFKKLKSILLLS